LRFSTSIKLEKNNILSIQYSRHLEGRLILRKIDSTLPKKIFKKSEERYLDVLSGHFIAVALEGLYGKNREVMIAYTVEGDEVTILTIHPLKEGQKENRVAGGRWRRL